MTGTTNRSRSNPLLTLQLFVLLIQVSIPLLYLRPSSSWSSIGVEIGQMPPQPQQLRNRPHPPPADESEVAGYFNGVPVTYVAASSSSPPLHSTAHCIGETFAEKSWVHRSCEYRNLCFDLEEMDFVLFRSPDEADLSEALKAHDMARGGVGGAGDERTQSAVQCVRFDLARRYVDSRFASKKHVQASRRVDVISTAAFPNRPERPSFVVLQQFLEYQSSRRNVRSNLKLGKVPTIRGVVVGIRT